MTSSSPTPDTQHLTPEQRNLLEQAVKAARDVAEPGARTALEQLAVDAAEPFPHMDAEARELRNRLRARARQLGDRLPPRHPTPDTRHLIEECAYEHWHRMLFARFLAENNVLMHPDGVAVTLEECEELAEHEGAEDGWEVAARYAARMLPQIFRPDAPVLQVRFPPEHQRKLEQILAGLSAATFTASDALGWVYQFWQAKKKDEVNKSEVKIGADELPAVTQLFTEPYMVDFLLHNTLGAWWARKQVSGVGCRGSGGKSDAVAEEELRDRFVVNGYRFDYLRFVKVPGGDQPDTGHPTPDTLFSPAAGTFDGWPKTAAEITVLDPCCGSGHFLVGAFQILVRFRMAEEGLSPAEACDAVLRGNIHGLEIDERCTQIAAFALALAAWTFPEAGGHRGLPELHIACSGLSVGESREVWIKLANNDHNLRIAMGWLYNEFQEAPVLGSLLDPTRSDAAKLIEWTQLRPVLDGALEREQVQCDAAVTEAGIAAQGLAKAAGMLAGSYTLIPTNVPYLTRSKQSHRLKKFCEDSHPNAKQELATVFVERCLSFASRGGSIALVTPQNWHMLGTYAAMRERLLRSATWPMVVNLGRAAFRDMNWWATNTALNVIHNLSPQAKAACCTMDLGEHRDPEDKPSRVRETSLHSIPQETFLENPDCRIVLETLTGRHLLADYAEGLQGIATADYSRFGRCCWEVEVDGTEWVFQQSTVREITGYGGRERALHWEGGGGALVNSPTAYIRGTQVWGRNGVAVSQMRHLPATLYTGEAWDNNVAVILPNDVKDLPAIWAFCSSEQYHDEVRKIDRKTNVTNATLVKVPFDIDHWHTVAAEQYPNGLPEPYSEDPTQWIFKGTVHPSAEPLQVAVARLLGYRWPEQADDGLDGLVDKDGIVCIPAVRGEEAAAHRLQALLGRAYGTEWSTQKHEELLREVGCAGKGLDYWLRHKFFEQHAKLFHHRPFIWHIWDGLKRDGFAALVNYHKLDRKLLETLTFNYLGDWIKRQEDGVRGGVDGAQERLQAARALQEKLELILRGEPPYDIFVRWKPLHDQPMGWEPDLNDGVRINIRPFMTAGALRHSKPPKLNIKWTKDRGKDPEDAPWYHLGPEYGGKKGDRINDHHLSLEEKRKARGRTRERMHA